MAGFRLTKAQMKEEVKKCGRDPVYFIKNYCKISHPEKGLISFKTYDFQEDLLKDFNDHRFNIILKARQLGISTIVAGYIAWLLLFRREKSVVVISTKFDIAANLVRKVKAMINHLPEWIKIAKINVNNQTSFELSNGSWIKASSTSADAGRSEALSLLVIDEAAFVEGLEDLWKGIFPTLSTGGRCIALSCVTKDTFVFSDKGVKTVGDFVIEDNVGGYEIEPYNVLGKDKLRTGKLFHNNGTVATKKMTSVNSYLEGSENHKLWAYSQAKKYDWHRLDELKVGDYISVQYGMDIWGNNDDTSDFAPTVTSNHKNVFLPKKITKDIAYVIGMYLAEGSVYESKNPAGDIIGGMTTFTCGDDLEPVLNSVGLAVSKSDKYHHCCSSKTFVEFLKYMGLDVSLHAPKKVISSRLMEMSRENIVALLQGLFDGDGHSRRDRGQVGIGLSSIRMIEQIRILLNNLGVLTEYEQYLTQPTELVAVSSIQHRLSLNDLNSRKFYDIIGFRFHRKQKNKDAIRSLGNRADPEDIIPDSISYMKDMFEHYPKGTWTLNKECGININGVLNKKTDYKTKNISRKNVLKMFETVKGELPEALVSEIGKITNSGLKWQAITKIEDGEAETFDFSLPDSEEDFWAHSVVYNGILGHQTPNGVGNWFHETYINAQAGVNDFHHLELPWSVHPNRDQEWFEQACRNLTRRDVAQEHECSFNMSGEGVISPEDLEWLRSTVLEPKYRTGFDRNYWIWEEYQPSYSYMVVADVARGDAADYSACHVFKIETMEQVAEYHSKVNLDMYANFLNSVGREYGNALMVVENNNFGITVLGKMIEMEYPNLYFSIKSTHKHVSQLEAEGMSNSVPGFTTSMKTRPLAIAKMEEFVRNKMLKLHSLRTTEELSTFVWRNGRPEPQKNKNDDLVMSLAIACWVRDTAIDVAVKDIEYNKAMLNSISLANTRFSNQIPGQVGYNRNLDHNVNSNRQQAMRDHAMYGWLYKG